MIWMTIAFFRRIVELVIFYSLTYTHMLWTIAVILIILWLLGLVSSYTLGGFIHILLVVAIIVILIRVIRGQDIL